MQKNNSNERKVFDPFSDPQTAPAPVTPNAEPSEPVYTPPIYDEPVEIPVREDGPQENEVTEQSDAPQAQAPAEEATPAEDPSTEEVEKESQSQAFYGPEFFSGTASPSASHFYFVPPKTESEKEPEKPKTDADYFGQTYFKSKHYTAPDTERFYRGYSSTAANVSLALGIIALVLSLCCGPFAILAIPAGIVGLILGIRASRDSYGSRSTAGIITSVLGLFLGIVISIVLYFYYDYLFGKTPPSGGINGMFALLPDFLRF